MLFILKKIDNHFEEFFCALMMGYIVLALNAEVFLRYIFLSPSAYTDEITRMLMLFIVFLGVPWAVKTDKHIIIDLWSADLSGGKKLFLNVLADVIFLIFAVLFTQAALEATQFHHMLDTRTEALEFPYWIEIAILPFSFALTCIRLLQNLVKHCRNYRTLAENQLKDH